MRVIISSNLLIVKIFVSSNSDRQPSSFSRSRSILFVERTMYGEAIAVSFL
ncbi:MULTISPECIES: hypothetical protein [Cyanophyceae]|uniref:hypothetical protein n=1 Tax=Cyanophyceae TaxID=3028117 RepID=UPI00143CD07E|nr:MULTISPECIES: hypothetical protein [Cyanophyceae]